MRSIRTKVMLLASSIIFALIVLLISGSFFAYRKSMVKAMDTSLMRAAEDSGWHLTNFLEGYLAPLEELSNDLVFQSMNWQVQRDVIGKQINPYYENVAVVDAEGIARYVDGDVLDLSDRNYIKVVLEGEKNISDVLISRKTGEKVMMAAVPIKRNEVLVGALIARLNRELLKQYITARGFGEFGHAFIISEAGDEIMSTYEEESYQNLFDKAEKDKSYNELAAFISNKTEEAEGIGTYRYLGIKYRAGYAKIEGTSWKVYISAPESSLLEEIYRVTWFIVVLTVVIGLGFLYLTWYMVIEHTKPILELSALMDRGASGDFQVYFETKSKDEIAKLGDSFNRLISSIKQLTYYDPLTLLRNRRVLIEDLNNKKVKKDKLAALMIQIEAVQTFTDTYGIEMTEELFKQMVKRMQKAILKSGQLYRAEVDSFVVLFESSEMLEHSNLLKTANRLRQYLLKPWLIKQIPIEVQFNFGALLLEQEQLCSDPMKAMAAACSYAKKIGSNQLQFFDRHLHQLVDHRNQLLNELHIAIEENELFLEFQPIYYIENGEIGKLEALIRWNHPSRETLYPNAFIEQVESSSLIIEMDFWVFEEVAKTLRLLKNDGKELVTISVNITSKTFESQFFLERIRKIIGEYQIDPSFIEIEITERMIIQYIDESIQKLEAIRELNMKVAIDDFGIGYSSLSYIVKLPIDTIKIDKSFIDQMSISRQAKAIVSTIINLCKSLDLEVVAEGIENKEQYEYLRELKCNMAQGYFLAKPMLIERIDWIKKAMREEDYMLYLQI
ncbi:MAG: EAL domain-containing protein [Vallitaleaceae bacterium]|nr:EAL domain-containing protein [Vallitaleaceae bacterium]